MGTISVVNIGKAYKRYTGKWGRLWEWLLPASSKKWHVKKWVLKNISFTVQPGEAMGIIGLNGAGKSTLLKVITGTTNQSTGNVIMKGRVAAMLELGMGFHPDFTGRQNVFMAGQLLGLNTDEIAHLMPEIEAFAELGEYIDQPVRIYSSGMQVRLAFSVATARRPDILIIDEALSVGDAYFQHKSFDRIRQFRKEGTTLLIVSHDKVAIQTICDQAIMLGDGEIVFQGDPEAVMDYYNACLADKSNSIILKASPNTNKLQTISGTGEARVVEVGLFDESNIQVEFVKVGEKVILRVLVECYEFIENLVFGYGIKDRLGRVIFGTNTFHTLQSLQNIDSGSKYCFDISFTNNLGIGTYSIQTALVSTDTHLVNNYEWKDLALIFNVINTNAHHFEGVNWMDPDISIKKLSL